MMVIVVALIIYILFFLIYLYLYEPYPSLRSILSLRRQRFILIVTVCQCSLRWWVGCPQHNVMHSLDNITLVGTPGQPSIYIANIGFGWRQIVFSQKQLGSQRSHTKNKFSVCKTLPTSWHCTDHPHPPEVVCKIVQNSVRYLPFVDVLNARSACRTFAYGSPTHML